MFFSIIQHKRNSASKLLCIVWLSILPFYADAQQPERAAAGNSSQSNRSSSSNVVNQKLASKLMRRDMPYIVILPETYQKNVSKRFPVLYLLHGLTGHYDNWAAKTKLADYAKQYEIIIVTPEGGDGWYVDSATVPDDKFESYILEELIPEIDNKYRTINSRDGRGVAGLSMGGYGALKYGIKHSDKFVFAGSMSGALGAASWSGTFLNAAGNWLKKPIEATFGETADTETRKANDIFKLAREITDQQKARLPFLYLDCGTEDFLLADNRNFAALLIEKKIAHEFRQLPGGHKWDYWDKQVQEVLRLSEKFFASKPISQSAPVK